MRTKYIFVIMNPNMAEGQVYIPPLLSLSDPLVPRTHLLEPVILSMSHSSAFLRLPLLVHSLFLLCFPDPYLHLLNEPFIRLFSIFPTWVGHLFLTRTLAPAVSPRWWWAFEAQALEILRRVCRSALYSSTVADATQLKLNLHLWIN